MEEGFIFKIKIKSYVFIYSLWNYIMKHGGDDFGDSESLIHFVLKSVTG